MNLTEVKGNTFFIKGGTNTGIYVFEDNTALMIDPGLCGSRPRRVNKVLDENNIQVRYIINTHGHDDHYGACNQFKEYYKDVCIMSSEYDKLYIENPELFSKYIVGGKSNVFMDNILKNKMLDDIKIDKSIEAGKFELNNEMFDIIEFQGHTPGSIAVLTKDNVIFVGDLLIGDEILSKYDFLFLYDIQEQINSLEKLKNIDFEYLVLGHGKQVISKEDSYKLIEKHLNALKKYLYQIRELLVEPKSLEILLKNIINNNNLSNNYKEYHFFKSSLVSVISYLVDLEEIGYILENGELLYYTKTK
ncbi:TPA: MBL fold metallo-hydrolase [Clostridioides difficile]|uniref:MBL fold metallo-hydrolase n=1 Tax=Clostridioides difficile TaxID=1496 RepID=UPI0009783472|nr:MBL fold metallo-hydrolase [Clostridioides difficile]EGT3783369.1 MBL fold metallo-hydrolase [Clostridioides difficile]EGT5073267.1 MBL fold metallo-hydrolase [Clostridioides difficile]ELX4517792.1 MBL fold metallo-hydrolase [Clostridioides difficile]MCZ1024464.1 MBL fold metallo-hydrolase [Clostridioides difficile]MDB9613449.1 MBL fold metallo-hydrolase [Clostridioides difficile]